MSCDNLEASKENKVISNQIKIELTDKRYTCVFIFA